MVRTDAPSFCRQMHQYGVIGPGILGPWHSGALAFWGPNIAVNPMEFRTRKIITPRDLNPHGTLFGGRVLEWIDEEAFIFASCQLGSTSLVTKLMTTVDFVSSAHLGDIVEIGCEVLRFGTTSVAVNCQVRSMATGTLITDVGEIVFVNVGQDGRPTPHGIDAPQGESTEV